MDMRPFILSLYSETNVHTGTGQSTGAIDLPVDRERHTDFPVLPSSGLKGSLRGLAEEKWGPGSTEVTILFGPETESGVDLHAGAVSIAQGNILAFPVRSLTNVFQWVTCPEALRRLKRDLTLMKKDTSGIKSDYNPGDGKFIAGSGFASDELVLEDLAVTKEANLDDDNIVNFIAENFVADEGIKQRFKDNTLILSGGDFQYLVKYTTEVRARVHLNEQKTTTGGRGNLWYEETLPRDCLFYALVRCMDAMDGETDEDGKSKTKANDVAGKLNELLPDGAYVRVGGNETVGMGWCATRLFD